MSGDVLGLWLPLAVILTMAVVVASVKTWMWQRRFDATKQPWSDAERHRRVMYIIKSIR